MSWEKYLDRSYRWVHPILLPEMPEAVQRALAAGAKQPLTFEGAGAYGIVLCDPTGTAFKVGRHRNYSGYDSVAKSLMNEGHWLHFAGTIPQIAQHVAKAYAFDEKNVVLIRECVVDRANLPGGHRSWNDRRLADLYNRMVGLVRPYGYRAPEFKVDAFVYHPRRGPVLVDAGPGQRDLGWANARRARELSMGARPQTPTEIQDVAHGLRMDAGDEIPEHVALRLLRSLEKMR